MESEAQNKTSVRLISLGCPKNLVDSEVMAGFLSKNHFVIKPDGAPCDVGIVNTCGFIEGSKRESIDTILALAEEKKRGNIQLLVVAGCLSQRYAAELPKLIPEADLFVGTSDFSRLPALISQKLELSLRGPTRGRSNLAGSSGLLHSVRNDPVNFIREPSELMTASSPRLYSTPPYSRYVKVSEGCSHACSFCTIPLMRGGLKSRPADDILEEIRRSVSGGVKEFNLIAQDLNEYGRELNPRQSLCNLLEKIASLGENFWIRLLYMYPLQFPDRLIGLIKNHPHVVPYADIPLQHIEDRILKSMKRGSSSRYIHRLIEKLKKEMPGIILRTTLIAGYPGETDEEFEKLHSFIKDVEFDRLGVFTYSQEEETPAARLAGQIPQKIRNDRRDILMTTQQKISLKKNRKYIGSTLKVLYEGSPKEDPTVGLGRFYGQAPEIDGNVIISTIYRGGVAPPSPRPGDFIQIKITGAREYDLVG